MHYGFKKNEKMLTLKDLQPGDILTFEHIPAPHDPNEPKALNDILSEIISKLTHSTITHSALYLKTIDDGNQGYLVDAGPSGIHEHLSRIEESNAKCYIVRLTKKRGVTKDSKEKTITEKEAAPIIDAAKKIVQQNLPYSYADLALVATILIYKDVSHVSLKQAIVIKFLQILTAELKTIIDNHRRGDNKGKHSMYCSTLVYQCFLDASSVDRNLKIRIKDGDLHFTPCATPRSTTLLDLFEEHTIEHNFKKSISNEVVEPDTYENLLTQMIDDGNSSHINMVKSSALCNAVGDFLETLYKLLGFSVTSLEDLLRIAKEQQSLFITPNDLCNHVINGKKLGYTRLKRYKEDLDENEQPISQ